MSLSRSPSTVAMAALARPHLTAQQAKTAAVLGVHRQHRVQQHPVAVALADLSEPAPASCRGCEVDFAGVLDRQYMAAFCRRHRAFAPAFDDTGRCHLGIAEKAVEPHFPAAIAFCQSPQADITARNHAFDERRPPLSRRRSPNRPSDQSICASMSTPLPKPKCRNRNHTNSRFWNPLDRPESICRTRCVHALARTRGPITTCVSWFTSC